MASSQADGAIQAKPSGGRLGSFYGLERGNGKAACDLESQYRAGDQAEPLGKIPCRAIARRAPRGVRPPRSPTGEKAQDSCSGAGAIFAGHSKAPERKKRTDELLADLAKIGLKPRGAMRFESGEAVKSAVRNGSGVGILYRDIIKAEVSRKEFAILPLVGTISRPGVIFFTPKRSRLRGRQNNFSCSCAHPSEAIARSDVQRKFRVSRSTRKPELGTRNRSCHRHRALDAGFLKLVLVVFPNVQVFVGVFDHHMVDGRAFQRKVESILSRIRGVKPKYASAASNRRTRSCS